MVGWWWWWWVTCIWLNDRTMILLRQQRLGRWPCRPFQERGWEQVYWCEAYQCGLSCRNVSVLIASTLLPMKHFTNLRACKGTFWPPSYSSSDSFRRHLLSSDLRHLSRGLLNWTHYGRASDKLPPSGSSSAYFIFIYFISIFITAWFDHATCHHISHGTTFIYLLFHCPT